MEKRYLLAGVLLGLSIASNLAILFPVLAVIVAVAMLEWRVKPVLNLALPALLIAALITGPSLRRAHKDDFYTGYPDFRWAVTSFVFTSFHAIPDRSGILGDRKAAERIGSIRLAHFLTAGRSSLVFCQRPPSTHSLPYTCNHHFRIDPGPLAARCKLSFRSNVPLFRDLSRGCLGRRRGCSQETASPGNLAVACGSPFNSILYAVANPIFRILAGGRQTTNG